jgi:coenzyme Q-binding protein COQ10
MVADMLVGFKALREKFTSRVLKQRPNEIEVIYLDGPLKDLDNIWEFAPLDDGGCEVHFCVDFAFKNVMFQALAGQYFDRAFRKMVAAFETRAEELYGKRSSSAQSVA